MSIENLTLWLQNIPEMALALPLAIALGAFLIARLVVARGLIYITGRTRNQWDDILVASLRPYRLAWLAPLVVILYFAYLWPDLESSLRTVALFLILWLLVLTLNSLLNAFNQIYESRANYSGVAIQGYLDLGKLLFIGIGIIVSISIFTGQSPVLLLSGLGAITAILLLIFQDTILSLVASVQIAANDLVREGDWIEVPGFNADGDVTNMSLHTVKVQNFDMTFTVIPTHKLLEVSYKNWRGMSQSGGRRIKRSIYIDISSIRFFHAEDVVELRKIDLLKDYLDSRSWSEAGEQPLEKATETDLPRSTNVGAFMAYIEAYLKSREDIRNDMVLLVRHLDPGPSGLPLEIYAFTNTTAWEAYESIQASIFDHLLATAPEFGLSVFQQPTGHDFAALLGR
jgi:miniconductance mechanosensitive channel